MSIAILNDVYTETRRLAIAGSVVAPGDFRLKKLIEPLRKAGEKSPVFLRVAECVERVVEATEQTAASALLELSSIISAVLYTQGATGIEGELTPLPQSQITTQRTQVSARSLKPLLEALTTTGSGRLEQIRSAYELNLFNDLRLVRPALQAIDDTYSEIGQFVADKILPLYGAAILSELRCGLDLKGKVGHGRRLKLIHRLSPPGEADSLVKQALEEGSKEVRLAAIECLGHSAEDLSFLLEQAKARSQDVRAAALLALARLDGDEASTYLIKSLDGKDLNLLVRAAEEHAHQPIALAASERYRSELDNLSRGGGKEQLKAAVARLLLLLRIATSVRDAAAEQVLYQTLDRSQILLKIHSSPGGSDLIETAIHLLVGGSAEAVQYLIRNRDHLPAEHFGAIFQAARKWLKPGELYTVFAPYLDHDVKKRTAAATRCDLLVQSLTGTHRRYLYYYDDGHTQHDNPLDKKWLNLAIEKDWLEIAYENAIPNHAAVEEYLMVQWEKQRGEKKGDQLQAIARAMLRAEHPQTVECIMEKVREVAKAKSQSYESYYWVRLAAKLPATAIPQLESLVADSKTSSRMGNELIEAIQTIRERSEK